MGPLLAAVAAGGLLLRCCCCWAAVEFVVDFTVLADDGAAVCVCVWAESGS